MAIYDAFSGKAEVIARSDVATTVRWVEIYDSIGQYSPGMYHLPCTYLANDIASYENERLMDAKDIDAERGADAKAAWEQDRTFREDLSCEPVEYCTVADIDAMMHGPDGSYHISGLAEIETKGDVVRFRMAAMDPAKNRDNIYEGDYHTNQLCKRENMIIENVRDITRDDVALIRTRDIMQNEGILQQNRERVSAMRSADANQTAVMEMYMTGMDADKQQAEKPEKKSSLIRVNNKMIHDLSNNPNRKAVTVGLLGPDGTKQVGTIYVGAKSIMADKKTSTLPDAQKKSYVGISRGKDYDFVVGTKGADGKWKNDVTKMKGSDIVDRNHAYMADKRAGYAKQADVPSVQAESDGVQME